MRTSPGSPRPAIGLRAAAALPLAPLLLTQFSLVTILEKALKFLV